LALTRLSYKNVANQFNGRFWMSVGWLAIPVSIFAVQLWLRLLQINAVRAGLWLFLCPLFGFIMAAWLLKDVISIYTVVGVVMVIAGLAISRVNMRKNEVVLE
jgi:probable blue pigment (indigoidine) exporter